MNDPTRHGRPVAHAQEEHQQILTAGKKTGWWDDNGRPAPWPDDFLDPKAGWTTGTIDAPTAKGT